MEKFGSSVGLLRTVNVRLLLGLLFHGAVLMHVARRVKFSRAYEPELDRILDREQSLEAWSQGVIQRFGNGMPKFAIDFEGRPPTDASVCVGIVSAKRKEATYLNVAVASTIRSILRGRTDAVFVVNDVQFRKPSRRHKHGRPRSEISNLQDAGVSIVHLEGCKPGDECSEDAKIRRDYAATIEACLEGSTAKFVTILEDDVLVSTNFVDRHYRAMKEVEGMLEDGALSYLRLYRTGHYDGFSRELRQISELIVIGGIVSMMSFIFFSKNLWSGREISSNERLLAFLRIIGFWALTSASIYALGRQNTIAPFLYKTGLSTSQFDASTVAVSYPRKMAALFAKHLREEKHVYTDMALNNFESKYDCQGFTLKPNPVQHLGRRTAIPSKEHVLANLGEKNHFAWFHKQSEWFVEQDDSFLNESGSESPLPARDGLPFVMISVLCISAFAFAERFHIPRNFQGFRNLRGYSKVTVIPGETIMKKHSV